MEMAKLCPMGKLYRAYIIIQIVIQLTSKTAQAEQQKRFSDDVKFTKKCTKIGFCQSFPETIRTFTFPLVQKWQMSMPMSVRNPSPLVDMLGIISPVTIYPCYNQPGSPLQIFRPLRNRNEIKYFSIRFRTQLALCLYRA